MVEVSEKLVEAVVRREVLVLVAEVVLTELPGRISSCLEQLCDGRVLARNAPVGTRHADFRKSCAKHRLAENERRTTRGAALLAVVVGEDHAFLRDAVDVRRAVAHQSHRVGADVRLADVVTPDNEDVWHVAVLRGRNCVIGLGDGHRAERVVSFLRFPPRARHRGDRRRGFFGGRRLFFGWLTKLTPRPKHQGPKAQYRHVTQHERPPKWRGSLPRGCLEGVGLFGLIPEQIRAVWTLSETLQVADRFVRRTL